MQCPACAREISDGVRFCAHCGAALASSAVETVAAPPGAAVPPPSRPRRPPSTDPFDQARFIPGTMVADRYRIVALLGRGGMGEVYRAEDLKLGQAVALKFLPERLAKNAERLARFHQEVRLARQIAHPNVCRVYDVGEADGQPYLSMEYVDGEDLASLLRRIGRLPGDKAVQLAKQLCAGLAAAHDRGVLHGDLKPANVLVDGRGRIRIADFGLAGLAEAPDETRGVIAGTPGYMAPEQLAGHGTSMRTDVYALGLVLYEMCTGKPALDRDGRPRQSGTGGSTITQPSQIIADLDPAIERVILRCLEEDPARRPPSAVSVAAALPGGDPLAAALAAGETPSPELVAAAGETGGVSPSLGLACLAAIVVLLVAITWMSHRTTLTGHVLLNASAEIMAERARTMAAELGHDGDPIETRYGYEVDSSRLADLRTGDGSPSRWEPLRDDRQTALRFWYQESPVRLTVTLEDVLGTTRPEAVPGVTSLVTDTSSRLLRYVAVPARDTDADAGAPDPDWGVFFGLAGLDVDTFTPVEPRGAPPVFVDRRAAWEGPFPDLRGTPVRLETGAYAGRLAYFDVVFPGGSAPPPAPPAFAAAVLSLVVVAALALARRNIRLGRADRRGAFRTAVVMGIVSIVQLGLAAEDPGVLLPLGVGVALFDAVTSWAAYAAFEPYVRRLWPEVLVGWRRLLDGRLRDPHVGRDVLAGILLGALSASVRHLGALAPAWLDLPPEMLGTNADWLLRGGRFAASQVLVSVYGALVVGLLGSVMLVLFAMLLRGRGRGVVAVIAFAALGTTFVPGQALPIPAALAMNATIAGVGWLLLVRFGLLAFLMHQIPVALLPTLALRFDAATPYAPSSYMLVGVVAGLALYGFWAALGGRAILGDALLRDEPGPAR